MKLFQPTPTVPPLGPLLREARESFELTLEDVAKATHLSAETIQALEEDSPLDLRRARIQAVCYLRFLQMNPSEFKDSLPALPELGPTCHRVMSRGENPLLLAIHSLLSMLAPMGKIALSVIFVVTLLGSWGVIRQLSRVRSMPWVSATYPAPITPVTDLPNR